MTGDVTSKRKEADDIVVGGGEASSWPPRWINQVCPFFRFGPTDEDLVVHFLGRKVAGQPLLFGLDEAIPMLRLYGPEGDPRYLFDKFPAAFRHPLVQTSEEFYAFTHWEHANGGHRPIRSAGPGTWSSNRDRKIKDAGGRIIGQMAHLTFKLKPHNGRSGRGPSTHWVMHEYRLPDPLGGGRRSTRGRGDSRTSPQQQPSGGRLVLCRIRRTKACEEGSLQSLPKKRGRGSLEEGDHVSVSKRGRVWLQEGDQVPEESHLPVTTTAWEHPCGRPVSGDDTEIEVDGHGDAYTFLRAEDCHCPPSVDEPTNLSEEEDTLHSADSSLLLTGGSSSVETELPELPGQAHCHDSFEATSTTALSHRQEDTFDVREDLLVPITDSYATSAVALQTSELGGQGSDIGAQHGQWTEAEWYDWLRDTDSYLLEWPEFRGQGTLWSFDMV